MGLTKKVDFSTVQTQIDNLGIDLGNINTSLDGRINTLSGDLTGHINTFDSEMNGMYNQFTTIDTNFAAYAADLDSLRGTNRGYIRREKTGNSSMAQTVNQTLFFDWQTRKQGTTVTCTDGTNFVVSKSGMYLLNCCLSITDNTVADGLITLSAMVNGVLTRLSALQYDENGNIAINGSAVRYLTNGTTVTFNCSSNEPFTAIGLAGEARTYAEILEL